MKLISYLIIFIFILTSGCTPIKKGKVNFINNKKIPAKVIPKKEKYSKYGNPKTYKVFGIQYRTLKTHIGYKEKGIASWYGKKFHGKLTSTREVYDMYEITAAHKTLPIPCYAKVTNMTNKRSIIVRVNDRGPFKKGRIIDLSYAAAKKLGIIKKGTAEVYVQAINVLDN
jgi:rare lipoprotein A